MSVLGTVSVTGTTVVKVAAVVGMVASAALLLGPALGVMLHGPSVAATLAPGLLGMAASIAGWQFAEWSDGKLTVVNAKAAQEAELRRLQGHHAGHSL